MNKTELARRIATSHGIPTAQAKAIVDTLFREMTEALRRNEFVALDKFGRFNVKQREARSGRNPRTGKELAIPASRSISFTTSKVLKEQMNS